MEAVEKVRIEWLTMGGKTDRRLSGENFNKLT